MEATAATGREPNAEVRAEADTVLVTYDNLPNGIALDIRWEWPVPRGGRSGR
jgi:hypothetical protein